jgi:hypothetical protein
MPNPIVFLAGIPSTRKSGFGGWARLNRGVAHIDAEHEWATDVSHFRPMWAHGGSLRVPSFVEALRADGRPFIFDWGFPVSCLPTVRAFQTSGADLWWLDGDRAAARHVHEQAGKSIPRFDTQIEGINASWPTIEELFPATRRLSVLNRNGEFLDFNEIYRAIFSD